MNGHGIFGAFQTAWFWAAFWAWTIAQLAKMLAAYFGTQKLDFHYFVSTGGMPSAHSAFVSGLATSFALTEGFDSPIFIMSLGFALTTMFDAATVRRAAGTQARLLNEIVDQLFKKHSFADKKLAELLGHTRFEVIMGMILGVVVGVVVTSIWGKLAPY